jgi:hypothetical protein
MQHVCSFGYTYIIHSLLFKKNLNCQITYSPINHKPHIMTSSGIGFDGFIKIPDRPVNFVPAKAGETIYLGQITCRILEDGSNTGMFTGHSTPQPSTNNHPPQRQPPRHRRTNPPPQNPRPPSPLARNARRDLLHHHRHNPVPRPGPFQPRQRPQNHRRPNRRLHDHPDPLATHFQ